MYLNDLDWSKFFSGMHIRVYPISSRGLECNVIHVQLQGSGLCG